MFRPFFYFFLLLCFAVPGWTQNGGYFAHFADGGGWTTTILITNTGDTGQICNILFYSGGVPVTVATQVDGRPAESIRNRSVLLSPLQTARVTTTGASATATTGFLTVTGTGIAATAIYRQSVPGRPDYETAITAAPTPRGSVGMHFDNRDGSTTALALANLTPDVLSVTLSAAEETGARLTDAFIALGPYQQKAFVLQEQIASAGGKRGYVRIRSTSPGMAVLGLLFNATGPFSLLGTF